MSLQWSDKADAALNVALAYKDTANAFKLKAKTFYQKIAQEYAYVAPAPNVSDDTISSVAAKVDGTATAATYVIQLGAGKMDKSYFDKVKNVEIVTPSDGIKRYIVGRFDSKAAALEYQKKMIALGYTDAFIRTATSLDY
jgi:hypothetical protein